MVDYITLSHLNKNCINIEIQWVICKFKNLGNIIIGNCYRPPKGNITKFIDYMLNLSDELKKFKSVETYLLGDTNINLSENTNQSRLLLDCLKLCNLGQIIKTYMILVIKKKILI